MDKNYNFDRKKLLLPEYGRHVHNMVEFLLTIEDRQLRNEQALSVIDVMGNINPQLRDTDGFKHKLWDHLFIMSEFKLDVDSPFPIPTPETLNTRPARPEYPKNNIRFKHYGRNVMTMIGAVSKISTEDPERQKAVNTLARYMKSKSQEFNNENANDDTIMRDINMMSGNEMVIDKVVLNGVKSESRINQTPSKYKKGIKPNINARKPSRNNSARRNVK